MNRKFLIAGEFSAIIRDALRAQNIDAWSCDILATEGNPRWHIQGDYIPLLKESWDGLIAHPECYRLANCANKWFTGRYARPEFWEERELAIKAFQIFQGETVSHIPLVAIENPQPSGYVMQYIGKYTQKVQPWQFGDMQQKGVCWWLKGFKPLLETHNVYEDMMKLPIKDRQKCFYEPPGPQRKKNRNRFFKGMAKAIAQQWSNIC